MLEILADVRKLQLADALRHGRQGIVGERTQNEIGIHAIRGGDVVGDHTVIFSGSGERVEVIHRAESRDTFVRGAIRAAKFLVGIDRQRARARALAADIEQIGSSGRKFQPVGDCRAGIEELPAVGETVGRDVDDAHH